MLTKIFIILTLILPVSATNVDDEIIKNLEFFQSMEMLKEETTLSANSSINETKEIKKDELKKNALEKK